MQQEHYVLKERQERFDDDHNEVHAELEHRLSRRNPGRATEREHTSINNRTTELDHRGNFQEASQTSNMSFDSSQTAFAQSLLMLDSYPHSQDNSQELTLRLEPESAQSPDLASSLSLSLEDSQGPDGPTPVSDNIPRTHRGGVWMTTW